MKNIYVICLIDINEKTEKDIEAEYASYHIRFPERPKEKFLEFLKSFERDKYAYDIDPQGYFTGLRTAKEAVVNNMADINECGSFPYVAIASKSVNQMYPDSLDVEPLLYEYNREDGKYHLIDWDSHEKFMILKRRLRAGGF